MNDLIDIVTNQGFAIAVAVYLLYERSKFNVKVAEMMQEVSTTLKSIEVELRRVE